MLEGLGLAAEPGGKDPDELGERPVRGRALRVQPEALRRDEAEHDDDGFVVGQHQRREPVAGPHAVAASAPALTLHRDADLLQGDHVAAHRARVDAEVSRQLRPGRDRPALQRLEE